MLKERTSFLKNKTCQAAIEDPMENTRFIDEGKQVPLGHGGSTEKFRWRQTLEEVAIMLAQQAGKRGKDLNVSIKPCSILGVSKGASCC